MTAAALTDAQREVLEYVRANGPCTLPVGMANSFQPLRAAGLLARVAVLPRSVYVAR